MIKNYLIFILPVFLLAPVTAFSGEEEKKALIAYLSGDVPQLKLLLAPDFQYQYFKKNKLEMLSRDDDLKSLLRLFKDTVGNGLGSIAQVIEDKKNPSKFRVKFEIYFEDSPKVYTDSFFRGSDLSIDETLVVTLAHNKIVRIVEENGKRAISRLSFGNLKSIYLKNVEVNEDVDGETSRLFDKDSHELLVCKRLIKDTATEYFYYLPTNQLIKNIFYPDVHGSVPSNCSK